MDRPIVTLTTDFGPRDHYVGVMKGVIASRCPAARIIDVSHAVPPQDVQAAAWSLSQTVGWFPAGTVHVVVVDPGVGTARRILASQWADQFVIAPDNGLLTFLQLRATPSALHVVDPPSATAPSATFHGRDIMAPAAARLAASGDLSGVGSATSDAPARLPGVNPPLVESGETVGQVIHVDYYGNIITNLPASTWGTGRLELAGTAITASWGRTYEDVPLGGVVAVVGSAGTVEVSVREGHAADHLGVGRNAPIVIRGTP